MNNFMLRTIFGALYVAVVVAAVVFSAQAVELLMGVLAILAVDEYGRLMQLPRYLRCANVLLTVGMWMTPSAFPLMLGVVLVMELFMKAEKPVQNWGHVLVAQAMIAYPFTLMYQLLDVAEWEQSRWLLLALFVCIWVNDSGAYCVGSLIGKHKMFPRVSPGKSWEGLAGGMAFALGAGYVFALLVPAWPLWQWLLIALTISVAGTLGDLMESLLKRSIGVKDSGKFLPGHGGVLDRFDSLLLATPALYYLITLLG